MARKSQFIRPSDIARELHRYSTLQVQLELFLSGLHELLRKLWHGVDRPLNFRIFEPEVVHLQLLLLEGSEDPHQTLVDLLRECLLVQAFATHEAIDDARELMKPVLVERRLVHRLRSVHARVHMLLAAQALVQHLLDGRLLTAA